MDELMHATATFGTRMAPSTSTGGTAGTLQAPAGANAWMAAPEDESMNGGIGTVDTGPRRPPIPASTGLCTAFCAPSGEAAVLCIDIDPVEEKFLLTSDAAGAVNVYDCSAALDHQDCPPFKRPLATPIAVSPSTAAATSSSSLSAAGHRGRKPVSVCKWYPHDNGLFITGGSDGRVVAWDTNRLQPAFAWAMDGPVYCVDMSPIAHSHSLLAGATTHIKHTRSTPVTTRMVWYTCICMCCSCYG
jgi:WD40 repeat protein